AFVNVQAAPAVSLAVLAPSSAVAGQAFDVTVIAQDPYGNTDINYGGTVTWATSDLDPNVVLPPDYPFQPRHQRQVTPPSGVTLITVGSQALVAYDTVNNSINGGTNVNVTSSTAPGHRSPPVSLGTLGQTPAPTTAITSVQTATATASLA